MKKIILLLLILNYSNFCFLQDLTFTDTRDGKIYKTVIIDTTMWMAENLSYESEKSFKIPNENEKYGYLYDYTEINKVCPTGWKLPEIEDWNNLKNFINNSNTKDMSGFLIKSDKGWLKSGNGDNSTGFNAQPDGCCSFSTGTVKNYANYGTYAYWWCNQPDFIKTNPGSLNSKCHFIYYVSSFSDGINFVCDQSKGYSSTDYFSVRCIKN